MILSIIFSYLIGSIPTAYLFGRILKNVDIREHGSGNVGATNAFRVLGKGPGIIVLLLDILKGVLATTVIADFFGYNTVIARVILGVVVVAGHNWTIFLQFKGGKGIATSLGVLVGLTLTISVIRPVLLGTFLVWLGIFLSTGYVSLASMIAATALPLLMVMTGQSFEVTALGVIFCLSIVLRHRGNIKRLLAGQESKAKLPYLKSKS